jgi:WD40 repeat protein
LKHQIKICSSHGGSENHLSLWQYPTMPKVQDFKGHQARVLNMEQSPESGCVVSGSADETFRLWDMFGSSASKEKDCFGMKKVHDGNAWNSLMLIC